MTITTYPEFRLDSLPIGAILPYTKATAPAGFLLCAGQAVSRTTYAELFALIGTTFGAGDNSTTFNVPDLRGRTWVGLDNLGGTDASRLDVANTLGGSGGTQKHQLTISEMPSHNHGGTTTGNQSVDRYGHWTGGGAQNGMAITGVTGGSFNYNNHQHAIPSQGGGAAHENMQPYMLGSWIVKALPNPQFVTAAAADESTLTTDGGYIYIKDLGVTEGKIATGAVTTAKVADNAVTPAKMAPTSGGLLGQAVYNPGSAASANENSNVATLVNAGLTVTFTGPTSGYVMVEMSALMAPSASAETYWTLFDASNNLITAATVWMIGAIATPFSFHQVYQNRIAVTPGASITLKWGFFRGSAGSSPTYIYYGGAYGPAIMTVRATV